MKIARAIRIVLLNLFVGVITVFAEPETAAPVPSPAKLWAIRAQTISHALVELKLQEVTLSRAESPDREKLALVREQQRIMELELEALVPQSVSGLEQKYNELLRTLKPKHPAMIALRTEIERRKSDLNGAQVKNALEPEKKSIASSQIEKTQPKKGEEKAVD
jgi:hypothetical protein